MKQKSPFTSLNKTFKIFLNFHRTIFKTPLQLNIIFTCSILLLSCDSISNQGSIKVKGINNEDISIPYNCIGCTENSINKQLFTIIINEIVNSTKKDLQYPLSFSPSNIAIELQRENNLKYYSTKSLIDSVISIKSTLYYMAKNGFGNELNEKKDDFFHIRKNMVDRDLPKKIELAPLVLEEGSYGSTFANRNIFISNEKYEFITISPNIKVDNDGVYLATKSSIDDGGFGTTLTFSFSHYENPFMNSPSFTPKDLVINSTKDYNQDKAMSYYNLSKEEVMALKKYKILGIRIEKYPNYIYCQMDKNLETYFNDFLSLKKVEETIKTYK